AGGTPGKSQIPNPNEIPTAKSQQGGSGAAGGGGFLEDAEELQELLPDGGPDGQGFAVGEGQEGLDDPERAFGLPPGGIPGSLPESDGHLVGPAAGAFLPVAREEVLDRRFQGGTRFGEDGDEVRGVPLRMRRRVVSHGSP